MKQDPSRIVRGFTLTEAAIVLGIVGLILGAIWVAAGAVYNNMRVQTVSTQIVQMVSGIRALYASQTTVAASSTLTSDLAKAGAIPKDLIIDPSANPITLANVWGGPVTITGSATGVFTIQYNNVPQEACSKLLMALTGQGRDSGLVNVKGAGAAQANTAFPLTISNALSTCSNLTDNTVVLNFQLRS